MDFSSSTCLLKPLRRLREQTCVIDVSSHGVDVDQPSLHGGPMRPSLEVEPLSRAESFSRAQSAKSLTRVESVESTRSDSKVQALFSSSLRSPKAQPKRQSFLRRNSLFKQEQAAEGSSRDASPTRVSSSINERTCESKVQFSRSLSGNFDLEAQHIKKQSDFLRRHMGRSTRKSSIRSTNSEGSVENDDDDAETTSKVSSTAKVYVNVLAVVALVVLDLILLIVLDVVWIESTCMTIRDTSEGVSHSSRWETITLKFLMVFMYLAKIFSIYLKLRGTRADFNLYSVCSNGQQDLLVLLIIVLGTFVLIPVDIYECESHSSDASFFESINVKQLQNVKVGMHLLRVIVACKALLLRLKKTFRRKLQAAVSQSRRRFKDPDGDFDLDLTYICDRLIAMSLPCVGGAFYRNDMRDVARFFANFHYGSFTVVNCCEAQEESGNGNYDPLFLYMQVKKFPMVLSRKSARVTVDRSLVPAHVFVLEGNKRDHNICSLRTIVVYCEFAVMFLNKCPDNVIAVHCQGGKGRTGRPLEMSANNLRFHSICEALGYFCRRRTDNSRGTNHSPIAVTSPSQRRYVHYLEEVIKLRTDYISPNCMILEKLTITGQPHASKDCCNFTFVIENGSSVEYDHGKAKGLISCMASNCKRSLWTIQTAIPVLISRDVSIRFYYFDATVPLLATVGSTAQISAGGRNILYGSFSGKQLMFVQFHTAFCKAETMDFSKKDLDGAYNKSSSLFAEDFMLTVHLDMCLNKCEHTSAKTDQNTWSADSIRQHELFLLRPRAHQVAYTDDQVLRIMRRLCPETRTFKKGEAIYNPAYHARSRVLYYVENGNVLLQPKTDAVSAKENPYNGTRWCHNGTTSVGPDMVWGCGQFISLSNFLLGLDTFWGDGAATVAYAYSETVTMRIWGMPEETDAPGSSSILRQSNQPRKKQKSKSKHQQLAPLRMLGVEAHDVDILYEAICFQIMTLSQAADNTAVRSMQQTVKYSQNDGFRMADLVRQARQSLGIPVTEPCKFSAEGRLLPASHLKEALGSMKGIQSSNDGSLQKTSSKNISRKQKYVWPITDDSSGKDRTYVLVFLSIIVVTDCCGRPIVDFFGDPISIKIPEISNTDLDSNVVKLLVGTCKSDCSAALSCSNEPSTTTLPKQPERPSNFRNTSPLPNVSSSAISERSTSPLRGFTFSSSIRNISPLLRRGSISGSTSPDTSPARSRRYTIQQASDYTDVHVAQIKYKAPSTKIQSSFDSEPAIQLQSAGPQPRIRNTLDRTESSGSSRWAPPRRGAARGASTHQISGEGFGNSGNLVGRDEKCVGHAPQGGPQYRNGIESANDQGARTPSVVKDVSPRSIAWGEPESFTEDSPKGFMGFFQKGMKRTVTQDDQAPKPEDESLALLFRDHYVAIEASGEIKKLISKEAPTSKKMHISCDVHPIAVMLGLVDIDGETGNLLECLEEKEVIWLREFLEHVPSITCAKGLVVVEPGTLNKCIYGVISGSLLVQDKDGVVLHRISPGQFLGHWSYFNSGNRGASASVVAGDEGTVVFEFSRQLMDKIRAKWPQINARFNRIQATEICKRYVYTETHLVRRKGSEK